MQGSANGNQNSTVKKRHIALTGPRPVKFLFLTICLCGLVGVGRAQQWVPSGPVSRGDPAVVLDPATDRMILFGGQTNGNEDAGDPGNGDFNDVWRLDKAGGGRLGWTQVKPTAPGPNKAFASAVYDPGSNRMIVFGGTNGGCTNDTWVLTNANGNGGASAWIQLSTAGGPPPAREHQTAVYDPSSNTMTIFAGDNCFSGQNDVWVLSNANGEGGTPTWTQLTPSGSSPSGNEYTTAVYDSTNKVMIVFGGFTEGVQGTDTNGVWTLSNANGLGGAPAWTQLSPSGTLPGPREAHVAVYDQVNNRMTIYGGNNQNGTVYGDIWVLSDANGLGGSPAWAQIGQSLSVYPNPRYFASAVYNPNTNKMIIFGGIGSGGTYNYSEVWVLSNANGL
jgi:hypothetical protein